MDLDDREPGCGGEPEWITGYARHTRHSSGQTQNSRNRRHIAAPDFLTMPDTVETLRRHDHDRFLATLFAPARKRPDLWALLAFNLEIARVREMVSEPMLGRVRLQWWREAIDEIYAGKPPRRHEIVRPLAEAIIRNRLTRAHFDALIDARELDLVETPPASLAELEAYASASAGGLFILLAEVLGPGACDRDAIGRVGTGWGLVGLIRAVPFHVATKRIFIPVEVAERADLHEHDIEAGQFSPALGAALAELATVAHAHLVAGRAGQRRIDRAVLPILLPARLADLYLARLAAGGYDPYDAAIQRPDPLAAWRMGWGWLTGRF
jgi:NADH dehydrogenase [ubiquinone] 1 alpha subcomplex assembly factor 6